MMGYEIVTPFITHINSKGQKCGLMVNRGWIVNDLIDHNFHYRTNPRETITGFIYEGDARQKYDDTPNAPIHNLFRRTFPEQLATLCELSNVEDAD